MLSPVAAMESSKKRKVDENGALSNDSEYTSSKLSPEDARRLIERMNPEQLIDILQEAVSRHADVLESVRSIADLDVSQRKLFIRGLGWDTTTDGLRAIFSAYGELEEAIVIMDKTTGKSKGYGFVTFKHVDGALLALKEPSKTIDGRVTVTQLAAAGNTGSNSNAPDVAMRKIYVANVPLDMPADKLLAHFAVYGEIEEGPLGFDKQTGKCRGYALFVYKKPEGAHAALMEPVKTIEGRQLNCKLANDGKKGKQNGGPDGVQAPVGGQLNVHGDGMGLSSQSSMPGNMGGQYGAPGGVGSYGGFSGGLQGPPALGHHPLNSSLGGPGLSSIGGQAPSSLGGGGGYGGGLGGPYGGYGGPGASGYGSIGAGALGGFGGLGGAGSGYRLPTSTVGMPSGGYPEGGPYGLSSSSAYPGQHHQPTGTSPAPRVPTGGMYPNAPPYY